MKVAIFGSGNGSNFENIVLFLKQNYPKIEISFLVCDIENALILKRAKHLGIKYYYISYKNSKKNAEKLILKLLKKYQVTFIFLAGFMRILSPSFIQEFNNRIVNIHPSLLPKYPGLNSIQKAIANRDKYIGATTHYVDQGIDTGKIILQSKINLDLNKGIDKITKEVQTIEYKLYIDTIRKIFKKYG